MLKGEVFIKSTQENFLYLSSTFSKLLKRRFGKGPETCNMMSKGNRLYVYMRNFITQAEEVLLENNELNLANKFRSTVINAVIKEFLPEVTKVFGGSINHFYHDWNYHSNTGIVLLENVPTNDEVKVDAVFENTLFHLIEVVGTQYNKRPASLKIVKFTQNICVIESKEVLLQLESLVYEQGNLDLLLHQAREIKSGYLKNKNLCEDLFTRIIEDIFIVWDYENNRNYLIFVFYKEYQ
ncbi:Na-translocating system protein MpsC family protein [Neobacillus drentensis]|uniref:Na-translocating system protein MpsC family protein n=1 Tax=Neobacillus drentensis TaxID=220684 RepID=UPI002FFE7FF2